MSKYPSREDLAEKADWEGGILELVFGYGMSQEELPDNTPGPVRDAFTRLFDIKSDVRTIQDWLYG